jgi:hypothetical protein
MPLPEDTICEITGATECSLGEVIQNLWSGYGVIQRVDLKIGNQHTNSAIIKHIDISQSRENRRGWSGDISHHRKVKSYQVEKAFYEKFASTCTDECRVPNLLGAHEKENGTGWIIVLEDLDAAGFDERKQHVNREDIEACLSWLANFHAIFIQQNPAPLWPIGTYWHLATRPDELNVMEAGPLKNAAAKIDERLNGAQFQTLVHGDAKLANFCFKHRSASKPTDIQTLSRTGPGVAAVDFQYVGGGCGMKDVAYLISSCLGESDAESQQNTLLNHYFQSLDQALQTAGNPTNFSELETEWRELYAFAWADFCRFLGGWSPGHWKMNGYTDRITQKVIEELI